MTSHPNAGAGDHDPIVILDHADEVAALATSMAAAETMLGTSSQAYLRSRGIVDPATWAAFRVDAVTDVDLARLLTQRQRVRLTASGLWLPTCDPRAPEHITGLIRLSPAQHQHRFVTAPVGIACPPGTASAPRIVLVDHPLLALRLHERGVRGIAMVEDPAVLVPLTAWLAEREVVTITTAKHGTLALPPGIVPVGTGRIASAFERAPAATLALLGLDPATLRPPLTALPLSSFVVRDLHAYAEGRLQTEAGMAALTRFGLDDPDVLRAYRVGYLPADVRQALTEAQRRMLLGHDLGNSVALPAYDAQGAVVDLAVMQACAQGSVATTVWEQPRGLCAPTLCTAFDRLVVTTVTRWVGRLFRTVGPTLLLRGIENARAEAPRIAAGGVRHVELRCRSSAESVAIAEILRGVGIAVRIVTDESLRREPPRRQAAVTALPSVSVELPPPLTLILVSHDAPTEQAVFSYGPATYTVHVPWSTSTSAQVVITVGTATHRDRFDLAVVAQRLRFASSAGLRTTLPPADIARALELILPAVQRLAAPAAAATTAPAVPTVAGMTAEDRSAAMDLLRAPDVLPRLLADLTTLGWLGDDQATTVVLLSALSRFSDEPVWTALTAELPGERFPALGILAAITPPEHLVHLSRLSDSALFHGGADALCHKLLLLDDLSGIGAAAATALRVLRARGVVTTTQVERDPLRGGMRTRVIEARGPVAVVTATTRGVPAGLAQHVVEVAIDERASAAAPMLAARQCTLASGDRARITTRLMNAQRLLRPLPVTIPHDATVPVAISRHRVLHDPFLGFVRASALLHQHQRPLIDGHLIATAVDVDLATRAVWSLAAQLIDGFGARAQAALTALGALGTTVTISDLVGRMPDWSLGTVRRAVDDLIAAGCLIPLRRRNGVATEYHVAADATTRTDLVSLSAPCHPRWQGPTPAVAHG